MIREEILEQLESIVDTYEILLGNGVNSDVLEIDDIEAIKEAIKALKQEPCEDAISRRGHWINVNEGKWNTIPAYKCSACGANADLRDWSGVSPFCPWCGAKMVETQEREV